MTVIELYNSVAQLGFETTLESDARFVLAANRAILQVNRIKPLTSIYKLNHFPLKNVIEGGGFELKCKDKEPIVFVADNAKSYYFECNGNGQMIIEKSTDGGANWSIIGNTELSSPDGRFIEYKGLIQEAGRAVVGRVRMRFMGEYIYYVQNVAMYDSLIGANVKDIPMYAKYTKYDIASLASDFISFASPPIVDAQRGEGFILNVDYFVEGKGKILIPASANGVFDISYNRLPKSILFDGTDDNELIDLDEELCAILPNLIASYIWVDDEPDKAQYYLSLYREQVAEIVARTKDLRPYVYRNKTGW